MAAINWDTMTAILMDYQEVYQEITKHISPIWAHIDQAAPHEVVKASNQIKVPLGLSGGHGYKIGALPVVKKPKYDSMVFPWFWHNISEEIDHKIFLTADSQTPENFLTGRMENRFDEMKDHWERMVQYDGSGKLATIRSAYSSPHVGRYKIKSSHVGDVAAYYADATKLFQVDYYVDVINYTNGAVRGSAQVVDFGLDADDGTPWVEFDAAVSGAAAGDFIVLNGHYNAEFQGLTKITDNDYAYGGLTHVNHKSYVKGHTTTANTLVLTRELFRQYASAFDTWNGKRPIDCMVTTDAVLGKISSFVSNWVNIAGSPGNIPIDYGFGAPQELTWFGGQKVPIYVSRYAPEGTIKIWTRGAFKFDHLVNFAWQQMGGTPWQSKYITGSQEFACFGECAYTIFTPNRRQFLSIENIKVD